MSEQQQHRVHFYHQDSQYYTHFSLKTIEALLTFTCRRWQFEFREQIGGNPLPQYGRIVAMCNVAIHLPPVVSAALPSQPPPINNLERMRMVAIPVPPSMVPEDENGSNSNSSLHGPSPKHGLVGMNAQCHNSSSTIIKHGNDGCMAPAFIKYRFDISMEAIKVIPSNPQAPRGGHKPGGGARSQSYIGFWYSRLQADMRPALKCCGRHHAGDMPTLDECQALEQAGLAISDADDNFLCVLHTFKSQHGAGFPSSNIPYDMDLNGHIVQAMCQISANIHQLVRSWVQHVEAGQYTVDMIDLLEVLWHPHVGYSLEPYTRGPPYPSQQSTIEMAIVYLGCCIECTVIHLLGMPRPSNWPAEWYGNLCLDMEELDHLILVTISWESFSPLLPACYQAYLRCKEDQARFQDEMIDQISHFIPNWMPRSPNKYAGFVFPWWVDRPPQYHADFQQMRGTRIFPIAHKYFQHTWPLQQLSMGDWIDEWMEEKWFALSRLLGFQDA
ncbi:hypothetical protein EDD16DRAFT_1528067 [Pisolithus croceorrhizus]|nr:hypothetical protein EDD16DRAFT_1528067 [Pisolithus croceorrhizus]